MEQQIRRLQDNLLSIRKIAGWTAEELGNRIGVTKQTISNIENGKVRLTQTQYIAIRWVFNYEVRMNPENVVLPQVITLLLDNNDEIIDDEKEMQIKTAVETVAATAAGGVTDAQLAAVSAAILGPFLALAARPLGIVGGAAGVGIGGLARSMKDKNGKKGEKDMSNTELFTDAERSRIATLSLIIVYEGDRLEQYAQMLKNNIDILQDDSSVAIFTAKQYVDNRPTFDSQKILFIGNGDVVKVQEKAVNWKFGIYGMQYGWLASRCVLTATCRDLPRKKNDELIDGFSEYCITRKNHEFPSMFQHYSKFDYGFFDILFDKGYVTWQSQYELLINVFLKYGFAAFMNGENMPDISYDATGEKMRKAVVKVFSPLGIHGIAFLAAIKNNGYAGTIAISDAFDSLDSEITANIVIVDISKVLFPAITELGIYFVEQTVVEEQYKKYKEETIIDEINKLRLPGKISDTAVKLVNQILLRHRNIIFKKIE